MSLTAPTVDPTIENALRDVFDPCCRDKGISVVDMGLLHRAELDPTTHVARIELLLTSGWCPFAGTVLTEIEQATAALPDVESASVEIVWDTVWGPDRLSEGARRKLRFLPDPGEVADPAAYTSRHTQQGESDDR